MPKVDARLRMAESRELPADGNATSESCSLTPIKAGDSAYVRLRRHGEIVRFAGTVVRKEVAMAGKPQNRLELRRQYEAAEPLDPMEDESDDLADDAGDDDDSERKPKKKAKAPAKPKAKSTKAPKPAARMRIVWAVVNDAFKTVGTFEYNQKAAAEARAAELTAKGKGTHFLQKVKEPMPDEAAGLGAGIVPAEQAAVPAAKGKKSRAKAVVVEDEPEIDEDEDEEEEPEEEEEDEE